MAQRNEVDDLLDGTLDDLADMPEFVVPHAGSYIADIVAFERKEINEKVGVELKLRFKELLEAADPSEVEESPQTMPIEASTMFFFYNDDGTKNELGQGQFKNIVAAMKEAVGGSTNSEVMANSVGAEVAVTTTVRVHKEDKKKALKEQRRYMGIKLLVPN